jgi:NitT/TauT family transport system permease protein
VISERSFLSHLARSWLKFLIVLLLLAGGVQGLLAALHASPAAFARPNEIVAALPEFLDLHRSLPDVIATLSKTAAAVILAVPLGLGTGLLVVRVPRVAQEAEFCVDFLRSIPATALVPLFLVIFGAGGSSKIAVGCFSGALAIAISVIIGLRNLDPDRRHVADLIGLSGANRFWLYELPEIAPSIFIGLRTAISLALILVVVGEMFIGSGRGLGRIIMDRRYSDDVPGLYAAVFMTGTVGFLLNKAVLSVEQQLRARLGKRA